MAARKKTLLGGVRIPRVVPTKTPTTKTTPTKTATKKRPVVKRTAPATLRERVEQTLESIGERMERVETEYYEIGQALLSLDRSEIWQDTFELRSFSAFIEKHLMPYATARRLLVIAREYTKAIATQIGLDRGYHLDRLARNDPEIKRSAQQLWIANVSRPLWPEEEST